MIKTFTSTQNEILRYVYNETSVSESTAIEEMLMMNSDALDFYLDCLEIKEELNKIQLSPKLRTIQSILSFSENYKPAL